MILQFIQLIKWNTCKVFHFYYALLLLFAILGIAVIIRKPTAPPKCAIAWSETSDDEVKTLAHSPRD